MSDLIIREAILGDLDNLEGLWLQLMSFHKEHSPVFKIKEDKIALIKELLKEKILQKDSTIIVAYKEDCIAGFLVCYYNIGSDLFLLNKKGYIAETCVDEAFRRQNIGEGLYLTALKWLKSKKVDHIQLQVSIGNPEAQKFWKQKGFRETTDVMTLEL